MSDQYKKPYLDSSVWISWIKDETKDGVSCKEVVTHLLKHAEQGTYDIYISTLVLAEVHKRRHSPKLTDDEDIDILAFFEHDYIKLVELDRPIAEESNRLCRDTTLFADGRAGLSPNDAVHLATAVRSGCDYLLAWDGKLLDVNHAAITVEKPIMRGQQIMNVN